MTLVRPLRGIVVAPKHEWQHDKIADYVAIMKRDHLQRTNITITAVYRDYVATEEFGKAAIKWNGTIRPGQKYGNGELIIRSNCIEILVLPMERTDEIHK
jgi:hypothetical protein